jgi:predicted nuclease of predicted toxin-antitoxin system
VKLWLDAQLSPALGRWLEKMFNLRVLALQEEPELVAAKDREIFAAAKAAGAVVMTKDRDFVDLVGRIGPPPQVLWITCGNTSNRALKRILSFTLPPALELLAGGEHLVEISDVGPPRSRGP